MCIFFFFFDGFCNTACGICGAELRIFDKKLGKVVTEPPLVQLS